ncbi:MAG: 5'-nucleotidase C-terminal domain-containing protein [Bacteroidaceae bacterium]|nr:5'-nucleotidase C-terminal domain-containing protein [Bacteroidaceae bacterium]
MKKTLLLFLFFNCQLSTVNWINAQRVITTERIEVTNVLDRNPDSEALRIVSKYKASVDSVMAPVLGESLVGMSGGRPESLLSNWAADVMVEYSDFKDGKKADLGMVNVGGLRNNMPKGVVRRGDIILISPFDNRLALVHIKGSDLLSLFQDVAAVHGEGVSREVRLVITQDGKLVDAKVSGQSIDPNRTYRIATLDYLAEGNDHLYSFKKAQKVDVSDLFSRDCMMLYVKQHSPITSKIEGRILVK